MVINEQELKEKAVNYGHVIASIDYEVEVINTEIKRLAALKESRSKAVDKLRSSISEAMQLYGIEKIDTPTMKLSIRKSESIEVVNEAQIPEEFMRVKTTKAADKVAIKTALKNGDSIDGVVVQTNFSLQIK